MRNVSTLAGIIFALSGAASANAAIIQSRFEITARNFEGGWASPVQISPISTVSGWVELELDTVTGRKKMTGGSIVAGNTSFSTNDLDFVPVDWVPYAFYFGGKVAGVPGFNMDGSNTDFYSYVTFRDNDYVPNFYDMTLIVAGLPGSHFRTTDITMSQTANTAVPEPATWAMMMVGFGAMGFALRRRQKVTTRIRFA